jgi:hypothetical protein
MREIRSEIEIDASADEVWSVLTDFPAFPDWNPFILKAEGDLVAGQHITVELQPPGHRATSFKPELLSVEPRRSFRWLGRVMMPGIFDGEHIHEIEPLGPGRVRYVQREQFHGVLVPFFGGMLRDAQRGFTDMNAALKARVERVA